ncbi:unnamed protein product [Euphydryas editha]|uniref:Uncharacterized protein n=1 Tax=Euphydryas editha TaxID=104508 RepID=A0AAU9UKY6_EUPED|nr:unnamed protein product [Euphydryas editha]
MKKVRFESPVKASKTNTMNSSECHSPRPFIEKQVQSAPSMNYLEYRPLPFTNDPLQRFESADCSPYPIVSKTYLSCTSQLQNNSCSPSNELDLSILDCNYSNARNSGLRHNILCSNEMKTFNSNIKVTPTIENKPSQVLASMENKNASSPPNMLSKKDNFFIRKDNLNGFKNMSSQFNDLHLDKENNPLIKKTELMKLGTPHLQKINTQSVDSGNLTNENYHVCGCHHCVHVFNMRHNVKQLISNVIPEQNVPNNNYEICHCSAISDKKYSGRSCYCRPINNYVPACNCSKTSAHNPQSAVDKKNWAIEKYEQNKKSDSLDVEIQNNVFEEKREPTVADLFKIIKLQNEQLQLLQEKVDKFISNKTHEPQNVKKPIQNIVGEHVEVQSIGTEEKISIGVMTSFEMFRTSTIINKELVKKSEAQIQCNRSQISIKEVVSKTPPGNLNFLDGIAPASKPTVPQKNISAEGEFVDLTRNTDNALVDKTLNEMSLYNVQVENVITPLMSPEQSLYLDLRDYSDSDSSGDDQSNVGWTYYNKVMTHVNGMLQESDMPSSASALYRHGKQKCLQVQIDKTNVSVAKRVTFGDQSFGCHEQPNIQVPTTDTSLKMNQLAAKYLKNSPHISKTPSPKPVTVEMSLATRNYMEKHKLLQGTNQNVHPHMEIPKFLDITALKQQPKFL